MIKSREILRSADSTLRDNPPICEKQQIFDGGNKQKGRRDEEGKGSYKQLRFQWWHLVLVLCGRRANQGTRNRYHLELRWQATLTGPSDLKFRARTLGRSLAGTWTCIPVRVFFIDVIERTHPKGSSLIVIDRPSIFRRESLYLDRSDNPGTSKAGQFPLAALIN